MLSNLKDSIFIYYLYHIVRGINMKHAKINDKEIVIGRAYIEGQYLRRVRLLTMKNRVILHRQLKLINSDLYQKYNHSDIFVEGIVDKYKQFEIINIARA